MKVGFSEAKITPTVSKKLSGFLKTRVSTGVFDDLFVKVLILESNEEYFGYISYDLLAVDHLIIEPVKKKMDALGWKAENFSFTATHTHSGPQGTLDTTQGFLKGAKALLGEPDYALIESIVEKTIQTVQGAMDGLQTGRIRRVQGILPGIGSNRNDEKFPGNDEIFALEFIKENHEKALLINFACHPTVLNMDNTYFSGDIPGGLQMALSEIGYEVTMFLNGSCGDISTRFTREGSGYEEVQRYSRMIAEYIRNALIPAKTSDISSLKVDSIVIDMKVKQPQSIEQAQQALDTCIDTFEQAKREQLDTKRLRIIESRVEGAKVNLQYAQVYDGVKHLSIKVQIIEIGDEIFITIPGEMFSQLTNPLQNNPNVHFVCYANGYHMYFADTYAYEHHFYEAYSSPFEEGESERLIMKIKEEISKRLLSK